MRFKDQAVFKDEHFSLGTDEKTGALYLSIPVSNGLVDYEEYYRLTPAQFQQFRNDPASAKQFLELCRSRQADELLIVGPGSNRGVPV
jgi:hypothetical protein